MESTGTPPIDFFNLNKFKMRTGVKWSGVEWRTLEKDRRWTHMECMDYIRTGGGLHKDLWGSVRYR
jgi:hypothetical protein